jgi:hypothetical protein
MTGGNMYEMDMSSRERLDVLEVELDWLRRIETVGASYVDRERAVEDRRRLMPEVAILRKKVEWENAKAGKAVAAIFASLAFVAWFAWLVR